MVIQNFVWVKGRLWINQSSLSLSSVIVLKLVFRYSLLIICLVVQLTHLLFFTYSIISITDSELVVEIEVLVINVLPWGSIGEVWVVKVLSSSLVPSDRLGLGMSPEDSWIKSEVVQHNVDSSCIEGETPSPPDLYHFFSFVFNYIIIKTN